MSFGFRVSFRLVAKGTLRTDNESIQFTPSSGTRSLRFMSGEKDVPIGENDRFVVRGEGYASPEAAAEMAESVRHALLLTFIKKQQGLDIGQSSVQSFAISDALKEQLTKALGAPVMEDRLGVTVFPTDPKPHFIGMSATGRGLLSADALVGDLESTIGSYALPTPEAETAAGLYASSHFVGRTSARLLLLVSAVEALLDPAPRSDAAIAHIDALIAETKAASLAKEDQDAICSALSFTKKISISEAGRRFAEQSLGDATYDGLSPRAFFAKIYKVRSDLVHKGQLDPAELHVLVGEVDRFVADILQKQFIATGS